MHKIHSKKITHGQRFLIEMMETRTLLQFTRKIGMDHNHTYIFRTGTGEVLPSCDLIFKLRNYVHPLAWFYPEEEVLPKATPAKIKNREKETYNPDKSVALIHLRKEKSVRGWALSNGLPYLAVYNITSGKYNPTFPRIMQMKHIIRADAWFIYKDELLKE